MFGFSCLIACKVRDRVGAFEIVSARFKECLSIFIYNEVLEPLAGSGFGV